VKELKMQHIAVLGLGIMGSGIARNLLKAGYTVHVYNRTAEKARPLLDAGALWASSPHEAAVNADVVISMVGDDTASRAMWLGDQGALHAMRANAIGIEASTLSVEWVRALHQLAQGRGLAFMDAPVTGSKTAAANGTLTFLVGAHPDVLARARPVLERCGSTILHLGPPASGAIFKLINNMMAAVHIAALGEGVAMADKAGLDMNVVMQALGIGAASSPVVKMKLEHVAKRDHTDTHFALRWMHKDVTYALRLADELGVAVPTGALTRELLRMAMQRGLGDQDLSALTEVARS
jgi:3-hydroxyisobutyrate dehydrogenase